MAASIETCDKSIRGCWRGRRDVSGHKVFLVALAILAISTGCTLIPSRCVIGITGSAASVTINGPGAKEACDRWPQDKAYYRASEEQVTIPVICEYRIKGLQYRVRDEGAFKLIGNQLCQNLQKDAGL